LNKAADRGAKAQGSATPDEEGAVRFDAVSKRFGETTALDDVSMSIKQGEFMTLLGPSGCGKTTLLNLAAGFLSPDRGEILVAGERMNDVPTYQREIGMMFQNYALFPHMNVAGNVAYGLKVRGVPKRERDRRVEAVLALVRLTGFEDRTPRQLSGGQQQRVALARALVINPTVLLLDEPFSALDKNLRASMQVELREIQRKLNVTTIFVTHDQGEALSLSDRVAVMSEGRIRQLGTPEQIYRQPCDRFVASFVGDSNVLRGRLDSIEGTSAVVAVGIARVKVAREPLSDVAVSAPVELFVRPEHLVLTDAAHSCATSGTIAAHVYQGGYVDTYIECSDSLRDRLLVRSGGHETMARWSVGSLVGISITTGEGVAFARI
jgi:putative spermidine/putrescine transport system ATP-binding protein